MQARRTETATVQVSTHHQCIGGPDGSPDSEQPAARRIPCWRRTLPSCNGIEQEELDRRGQYASVGQDQPLQIEALRLEGAPKADRADPDASWARIEEAR